MRDKYSRAVSVEEILDMYSDPEAYFSDQTRQVSKLYKAHALAQLKSEFRKVGATAINRALSINRGLYYPTVKELRENSAAMRQRKSKRSDHECLGPQESDLNFLKVTVLSVGSSRAKFIPSYPFLGASVF